jgi:hypothetical protein
MEVLGMPMYLFLSAGAVALFSYLAVAAWSDSRQRERKAYYESETLKKITEVHGANAEGTIAIIRELDRSKERVRREGLKLGGLVTGAVGLGLLLFLRAIVPQSAAYAIGLIPLFVGMAFLVYIFVLAPKE